jgi:hypothetical protein
MSIESSNSTVFVLVTDAPYFSKAKRTIIDLRTRGNWKGDIVLLPVQFDVSQTFAEFYNVQVKEFPPILEKNELLKLLHYTQFVDSIDGREINKINQWEKLHVFDPYFTKWERVVFLDAGLRVLDDVHNSILQLPYKDTFLAPDDGGNYVQSPNPNKLFETQVSKTFYKRMIDTLNHFGGIKILKETYFLNCMWVYDTNILKIISKDEMIAGILQYPICKTNEMTLMNLFIHFKHKLWRPFPVHIHNTKKILFDWCETNNPDSSTWKDYSFLKYPCTISFEDT